MMAAVASSPLSSMLDRALALAAKGFQVFPLRANSKKPPLIEQWQIHATTDEAQIRAWWSQWPAANIGWHTAELVAIDVDVKEGKDGAASWDTLELLHDIPPHPVVITPTGGQHHLFLLPVGVELSNVVDSDKHPCQLGRGIDIRTTKGFLVAAGSVIDGKEYMWVAGEPARLDDIPVLPDSLVVLCPPAPRKAAEIVVLPGVIDEPTNIAAAAYFLAGEAEPAIEYQGGDNTTFKVVCRVRDLGISEHTALQLVAEHYNPRCIPPWPDDDLHRITSSVYRNARNPLGVDNVHSQFSPIAEPIAPAAAPEGAGLPLIWLPEIRPVTDTTDFVEDLLGNGQMSVVYGDSNSGKTFFALDLALHVALGREWFGKQVDGGGAIYIAAEGGFGIRNRVTAFLRHHRIVNVDQVPFAIVPKTINLLDPKADTKALIAETQAAIKRIGGPVRLIVVDTLARAIAGGNENASEDMGALVANADRIRDATGAHLKFIHHSGKDTARGARGHSSLRAATDTEIEVTRDHETGISVAKVTKQRELPVEGEFGFRLEVVQLGVNRRLKTVTSCAVVPVQAANLPKEVRLSDNLRAALTQLKSCLLDHGQAIQDHPNIPDGPVVSLDQWREYLKRAGVTNRDNPNSERSQWSKIQKGLSEKGVVGIWDAHVWLARRGETDRDDSETSRTEKPRRETPPYKGVSSVSPGYCDGMQAAADDAKDLLE